MNTAAADPADPDAKTRCLEILFIAKQWPVMKLLGTLSANHSSSFRSQKTAEDLAREVIGFT